MDGIDLIKERRSIRNFNKEKVPRDVIEDIISISRFSPSWANSQIARYNIIDDEEIKEKLARSVFEDFKHNENIVLRAAGVLVVSYIKGKSGYMRGEVASSKGDEWGMFDSGVACQTFSLAAFEKGVGSVILGIFDDEKVAEIINLPEDEVVAAIIPYGYEVSHPLPTPRKGVNEILRFI